MPLSADQAIKQARELHGYRASEREALDQIRRYWKGRQKLPAVIPASAPREVRNMARIARVNVCQIVIDTLGQSTFVDGFRAGREAEDLAVWDVWQANRMDKRQTGIHKAAFAYGASYAVVLPGDPVPVIRGGSPRKLTAVYGEDQDWPMWALEDLGRGLWRLYDDQATYFIRDADPSDPSTNFQFLETREHNLGVCPVVRYLDEEDLDAEDDVTADHRDPRGWPLSPMRGQIAPLFSIQDQIDLTTFGLLVAQHYAAFRQRYIIGWVAESEKEAMKASASQFWQFDEDASEVKIGEFEQTDLSGYIASRDASLRHAAALSQTPVHELTGTLINMAAEALVAAEAGKDRKADERQTSLGESHEQTLWLAGQASSPAIEVPDDAQVVWRDTSARAFAATVDALGKLAQMLGVPPQELWERIPGTTSQDIERWKKAATEGNSFDQLTALLDRQAANGNGTDPAAQPSVPNG